MQGMVFNDVQHIIHILHGIFHYLVMVMAAAPHHMYLGKRTIQLPF